MDDLKSMVETFEKATSLAVAFFDNRCRLVVHSEGWRRYWNEPKDGCHMLDLCSDERDLIGVYRRCEDEGVGGGNISWDGGSVYTSIAKYDGGLIFIGKMT